MLDPFVLIAGRPLTLSISSKPMLSPSMAQSRCRGPKDMIGLMVNGERYELQVEPNVTLYTVIHDRLGLTGVKMFCDRGACGSCTVIMNGRPVLSCMTLAIECDGATIETAEGIAAAKHPLIETYVKHHCMQCGYCTPGFVVTAKALLDRNPNPTEEEIREALSGNLCRCGTYPQHPKAVAEAASFCRKAREDEMNKDDSQRIIAPEHTLRADKYPLEEYSAIGRRGVRRKDGYEKATGYAVYTTDVQLPGQLWLRILTCPYPHARIKSMDTSKAAALPGVQGPPQV